MAPVGSKHYALHAASFSGKVAQLKAAACVPLRVVPCTCLKYSKEHDSHTLHTADQPCCGCTGGAEKWQSSWCA